MTVRRPVETRVERDDGIWGCVADGVVRQSMRHVSGRQPPHAAERSTALGRERGSRIQQAELLADLVVRLVRGAEVLPAETAGAGRPAGRGGTVTSCA